MLWKNAENEETSLQSFNHEPVKNDINQLSVLCVSVNLQYTHLLSFRLGLPLSFPGPFITLNHDELLPTLSGLFPSAAANEAVCLSVCPS